jgi:hypothetical protein
MGFVGSVGQLSCGEIRRQIAWGDPLEVMAFGEASSFVLVGWIDEPVVRVPHVPGRNSGGSDAAFEAIGVVEQLQDP